MKFAALKFEHPKECRIPLGRVAQRPMGTNLRLTGILGSGIQNTAQGIRNSLNDRNPESKFH